MTAFMQCEPTGNSFGHSVVLLEMSQVHHWTVNQLRLLISLHFGFLSGRDSEQLDLSTKAFEKKHGKYPCNVILASPHRNQRLI